MYDGTVSHTVSAFDMVFLHSQVACVSGHKSTVETLLAHKARKHKRNFMKETAVECIGKCRAAAGIRALLTPRRRHNVESKDDYYHQDAKAEGPGRSGRYSAADRGDKAD